MLEYYAFSRNEEDLFGNAETTTRRRLLVSLAAELLLLDVNRINLGLSTPDDAIILTLLYRRAQSILSEFNRLGEHSRFSSRSLANINTQLEAIREITGEPIAFSNYLIKLNPAAAGIFINSLDEAIELIRDREQLDETSISRMLLLLTSLTHQLDDFRKLAVAHDTISGT